MVHSLSISIDFFKKLLRDKALVALLQKHDIQLSSIIYHGIRNELLLFMETLDSFQSISLSRNKTIFKYTSYKNLARETK
jgi:hypothetical protein